ncbi:hypothetical protein [Shewanella nanhaiensis]|uniref:Uncharacterized protein n=1 Tax=Shewanella nanhaiensis TaxID=2864872 RepID=A0ABS7E6T6_9GAMM|nr:hypothetical protein [Shewanella nanhaiensis]MBW8184722.1 hypothetical protein [Shewanella nanhaiensis]
MKNNGLSFMGFVNVSLITSLFLLSSCAQVNDFPIGESYQQVKAMQVLDPDAPERNEGVVGVLNGKYGEKVMKTYRESSVEPSKASGTMSMKVGK